MSLKSVYLKQGDAKKLFNIEEILPFGGNSGEQDKSGGFLLIKFAGYDSPEAVKTLAGAELIGDRSQAAPLKDNEFYIEDLKGLEVVTVTAELLGQITDVIEGGGGDLAEIRLLSGETKLVPFRKEFFGDISMEKRRAILLEQWILE